MTICAAGIFLITFLCALIVQHRTEKRSDEVHREMKKVSREIVTKLRTSGEQPSVGDMMSPVSGSWPPPGATQ